MKNLSKIKTSRKFKNLSSTNLAAFAKGTKFAGDVDATAPTYTDAEVHGAADNMLTAHNVRQINPSKQNTDAEKVCRNILIDMLDANTNYLDTIANKVAKTAGDVEAGLAVVSRIGFLATGKTGGRRKIGFIDCGVGWAHAHEAKGRKGTEGHVWRCGIPPAKGTPPTDTSMMFSLESDFIFTGLESGTVLAYCHGSIAPINPKNPPSGPSSSIPSMAKSAMAMPMNKAKHPMGNINDSTNVTFGEWRYITNP